MKSIKIIFSFLSISMLASVVVNNVSANALNRKTSAAINNNQTLLASKADSNNSKAQNNILFWNGDESASSINCQPGGASSIGGINSAVGGTDEQQVYWCALLQVYDETHAAAIFGNILGEGAFNPVRWQYGTSYHPNDGGPFTVSWETIYNSNALGVGVIQITSLLSDYLHYINDKAPDLLKYFQDPEKYSYAEGAMSKIGDADFRRLVVLEINYINEKYVGSQMAKFKSITDVKEASKWWTRVVENCPCCGGSYANENNGGCSSQLEPRASAAEQQLQSMSGTSCSSSGSPASSSSNNLSNSSSSSTSSTANGDITWIGDSYSVGAKNLGLLPSGADTGGDSYIQVSKFVSSNKPDGEGGTSCLDILDSIIKSGNLKSQLVFACGTNGGWSSSDISRFEKLIKDQNVSTVVVTSRTKNSDYADSNNLLKNLASSNSKVKLADWAAVYKAEYYASDSIHPNDGDGYKVWTGVITSALSSNGGGSCSLSTVEIPSYNQCSGSWSTYPYNYAPGKTICSGGCGPSSMAMLVSVLTGQTVYPNDIVDLTTSAGQYPNSDVGYELTQIVAEKYNLEAQKITYSSKSDAYDKIKKYLNDGYVIHLSGEGSHAGFSNSNTSGHYIGLVSIDSNDKVRVANSNSVGNNTTDLQNIVDAIHNGAFVILKNKNGSTCNSTGSGNSSSGSSGGLIDYCSDDNGSSNSSSSSSPSNQTSSSSSSSASSGATTTCGEKVLASAQKIIDIANQYGFDYNQGSHDLSGQFDEILKGRYFETDCTGFASFVMYAAFGTKQVFWTGSIASMSDYKEIPKDQVQVGDIFNYNYGCTAHGGIITKIENGKITEIAQTGRASYLTSGTSAKNQRLGYSYYPNLDNGNLNCVNNASDVKYYRYKECE